MNGEDEHRSGMEPSVFLHRGTRVGPKELSRIQRLVDRNEEWTRSEVAHQVCKIFGWRRPNGELAVRSCQDFVARMERRGLLRLPRSQRATGAGRRVLPELTPEFLMGPSVAWTGAVDPLAPLTVRPIVGPERVGWQAYMERYHYLGCRPLVGESLRYVALAGDELVALLGWASAALNNGPRDSYLGWDERTRSRRLHLVVNNTRFLVLPWVHEPNLASQILAANLRRLSADWREVYGHPILLAETFVDLSRFHGTCYRASNWVRVGQTQGWSRSGYQYERNNCPKAVFVYPLHQRAQQWLTARTSPVDPMTPSERKMIDVERLPLNGEGGLLEVLDGLLDARKARGKRHTLVSILAMAACATLCGVRSMTAIAQWASELSPEMLKRLGCPRPRPPSEPTFRRVLGTIDVAEMDRRVGEWNVRQTHLSGQGVALDGKSVRGSRDGSGRAVHLVGAVPHEAGVVVAQTRVPDKTNEIKSVRPLLDDLDVRGAILTGDAMFAQLEIARYLVEDKEADYLFTIKGNQPTLRKEIEDLGLQALSPPGGDRR